MKKILVFLLCSSILLAEEPKEVNAALESSSLARREAWIHAGVAAAVITATVIVLVILGKNHHSSYQHDD